MPLCGSSTCGCAIVSVPAVSGEINGYLPSIEVAGSGTTASPWNLTLNDDWASQFSLTPWVDFSYASGWENYQAGFQDGQYRKRGDEVQVRGMVKRSSSSVVGNTTSTITTLPAGFRPGEFTQLVTGLIQASSSSVTAVCQVRVTTSGTVVYFMNGSEVLTTTGWVAFNFSFSTTDPA